MKTHASSTALDVALIDEYCAKINALGNRAVIETGRLLQEFKDKVGRGNWMSLLKRLGWQGHTAERFVQSYHVFGNNSANLENLPQSAPYLLAAAVDAGQGPGPGHRTRPE